MPSKYIIISIIYAFMPHILCNTTSLSLADCPVGDAIKPCICHKSHITCDEEQEYDLKAIIGSLSDSYGQNQSKHFNRFEFTANTLTELSENLFKDITAAVLWLMGAEQLKSINVNAFHGMDAVVKQFELRNCPVLNTDNIFTIVNKFVMVDTVALKEINLVAIPSGAFARLTRLHTITIYDSRLKTIGDKPFAALNSLQKLELSQTSVASLPKGVLVFSADSNLTLRLTLQKNEWLNNTGLGADSLSQLARPTIIYINHTFKNSRQWKYLAEKAFKPFFAANDGNKVLFLGHSAILCGDVRNKWLNPNFIKRLLWIDFDNKVKQIEC
ncbi:unnamed protein product [Medioppia subpectinata]|uniref:Uncharacterized protein n=1 Tax=Medioppia subpectinata TaxID=1979941 RepID=A0A7R9Q2I6_9ACAR|nr:unnamed protein product [Medioppia subpectinata]CAG2110321.1 unnamed protein product [Medioppia subpectinata]